MSSHHDARDGGDRLEYWAFISYSSQDVEWAEWLMEALERYRIPRGLVGRPMGSGSIPRRLVPVFRDRDELSSAPDLQEALERALRRSRRLVVVCSPRSASPGSWVDHEARTFKALGRSDDVLALIVDGEPGASDGSGDPSLECFPPALRFEVDGEGQLTSTPTEPLAADVRREADHPREARRRALVKLVAGILGVDFDDLWQRDQRRRRRRIAVTTVASALLIAVIGILSAVGIDATRSGVSVQLADRATAALPEDVQQGLLLGVAAYRTAPTPQAYAALLRSAALTSHLVTTFLHPGERVTALALDLAGGRLAVATCRAASCDGSRIHRYDLAAGGAPRPPVDLERDSVAELAFDPGAGGLNVVVAGDAGGLVERFGPGASPPGPDTLYRDARPVTLARWSPDGEMYVVAAGNDGSSEYKLFPEGGGRRCGELLFSERLSVAAFDPDGSRVALGGENGSIVVVDTDTCRTREARTLGAVADLAFDSSSSALLSILPDGTLTEWTLDGGLHAGRRFGLEDFMLDGFLHAFSPGARHVASKDGRDVLLFDVGTRRSLMDERAAAQGPAQTASLEIALDRLAPVRLEGHGAEPTILTFSGDGRLLATADDGGGVLVWDVAGRPLAEPAPDPTDPVPGAVLGESGVSAVGPEGRIRATLLEEARGCSGDFVLACERTIRLVLTDAETGEAIHTLEAPLSGLAAVTGSDTLALAYTEEGNARTTALVEGRPVAGHLWHIAPADLIETACTRANRRLAAGDEVLRSGLSWWERWLVEGACRASP